MPLKNLHVIITLCVAVHRQLPLVPNSGPRFTSSTYTPEFCFFFTQTLLSRVSSWNHYLALGGCGVLKLKAAKAARRAAAERANLLVRDAAPALQEVERMREEDHAQR